MGESPAGEITQLLARVSRGDREAEGQLLPHVYNELRRLAAHYIRQEKKGHTLQATALVHEAYLRMVAQHDATWQNRNHFFAVASQIMRRVLVDHARTKLALKRGGDQLRVTLDTRLTLSDEQSDLVMALDEALDRLKALDKRQVKVVEMRFFGGLTETEIAVVLGVSERTVKRDWKMAKAWLYGELARR